MPHLLITRALKCTIMVLWRRESKVKLKRKERRDVERILWLWWGWFDVAQSCRSAYLFHRDLIHRCGHFSPYINVLNLSLVVCLSNKALLYPAEVYHLYISITMVVFPKDELLFFTKSWHIYKKTTLKFESFTYLAFEVLCWIKSNNSFQTAHYHVG